MKDNSSKQELVDRIVAAALESFMEKGINAVKMDDISSMLSISKRTLYEQFSNKEALLLECIKAVHLADRRYMEKAASESENVLEIIMKFYEHTVLRLKRVNPQFFQDLVKYPRVSEYMESCKLDKAYEAVDFFHRGVEQGYFRSDVNYEIFHLFVHTQSEIAKDKSKWEKFSIVDIFNSILIVNVRGISTTKGLEIIDRYIDKQKLENKQRI